MDRITLPSGKTYDAFFAGESLSTGNFNAKLMPEEDVAQIVADFSGVSEIMVESPNIAPVVYAGYTHFEALRRLSDGILIKLSKDDADG